MQLLVTTNVNIRSATQFLQKEEHNLLKISFLEDLLELLVVIIVEGFDFSFIKSFNKYFSKPYFNPRHHTLEEKEERNGEKDERRGRKTERKEERGEKNEEKEMKLSRKDERKEERREKKERKEDVEMKEEKEMVWHRAKSFRTVAEFDAWAYRVHFYQTWAHRPPNIQTMYGVNHFYVCGDPECPAECKVFYHEDWRVTVYRRVTVSHFHLIPEFWIFNQQNNGENGRRNSCMYCLYSGKYFMFLKLFCII
uniref:Uncharacterized protein n=2 Tax=Meloidogyne TaxID=189290 RepID=A0A914L1C5_MELIC